MYDELKDYATGEERFTLSGHTGGVAGCAFSPDGRFIVSASGDNTLKVWDITIATEPSTRSGYTDGVKRCAVSPDGRWIVSTRSHDGTHKIWDAHTGAERFALSPLFGTLNTYKVWDITTGKEHFTLSGRKQEIIDYDISSDGRFIVSCSSEEGTFKVWDIITGKKQNDDFGEITSHTHTFKVWDIITGKQCFTFSDRTGEITSCVVSPDSRFIVSVSWDKTLKVWESWTGRCVLTFPVDGELFGCAFHPDGERLVACGGQGLFFLRLAK